MLKNIALLIFLFPLLCQGQIKDVFHSDLKTEKKPWTNLDFANDPDDFQFAIISDRTGGPRKGVFEDGIKKLNWLMPEFVITVGDLIKGASGTDSIKLDKQWKKHFERIAPLKMPFFHLAGNHDIKANNDFQVEYWNKMFGAPYYSFVYKNVLFIALFSNQGTQTLSEKQIVHFQKIIKKYQDVKWTMVFLHHPLWRYPHKSNFNKIEQFLANRKYTVFAGHQHQYHHSEHHHANYYVLGTTGGGSPLLGNSFGSFDHITWVTMSDEGPIIANLRLDGILPHDVANDETHELTRELIKSTNIKTNVFVDSKKAFNKGIALITYENTSDHPLYLEGQFFHNHHVLANPSKFENIIPANSSKTIEVKLEAIKPFNLKENIQLEYTGNLGYRHEDYPDLTLSGSIVIPIQNSSYNLLPTKTVEFVESYMVKMNAALPGTTIRYTTDGSSPKFTSKSYQNPFIINKTTTVKASLFTIDGKMKSKAINMKAKAVQAGKGLIVEHYPYGSESRSIGGLPDFSNYQPQKIETTKILDPVKVAGRKNQFALIYKGYIDLRETGDYIFTATSDDGIRIIVNGIEVVSDAVKHKARKATGQITLPKGKHSIEIQYFQWKRKYAMDITYTTPSGQTKSLTANVLSYDQNVLTNGQ